MSHQDDGLEGRVRARPRIEEAQVTDELPPQRSVREGIRLLEVVVKRQEVRRVGLLDGLEGDRRDPNRVGEAFDRCVGVEEKGRRSLDRVHVRAEPRGVHDEDDDEEDDRATDGEEDRWVAALAPPTTVTATRSKRRRPGVIVVVTGQQENVLAVVFWRKCSFGRNEKRDHAHCNNGFL